MDMPKVGVRPVAKVVPVKAIVVSIALSGTRGNQDMRSSPFVSKLRLGWYGISCETEVTYMDGRFADNLDASERSAPFLGYCRNVTRR
jgi:hypothetical protein